ncbi:dockerin type I domain-containing protein [bacterium]|nr:dockerin type I domain-containing protein [bacterium]
MNAQAGVKVTFAPSTVTIAAGGTAQVTVTTTVDPAAVADGPHEGIITLSSTGGTLHVPYIYWRNDVEVPQQLSGLWTSTSTLAVPGGTMDVGFNIGYGGIRPAVEAGDVPQGSSFASQVVTTVISADGTTTLGTVYRRSLLLVGDHTFTWNGRDVHGNLFLADGDYQLRTSVMESNNDPTNLLVTEAAHQSVAIHVTGAAGVPILRLSVVGGSVREGEDLVISLTIDTTTGIGGVMASLQFEPYYVAVKSIKEGDFLNQGGRSASTFLSTVDASSGVIHLQGTTGSETVQGHGSVCTVTFTVLHSGSTELWIEKPLAVTSTGTGEAIAQTLTLKLRTAGNMWDITGDNRVDLADMVALARAYGSKTGDRLYDAMADLNGDGRVDDADLQILRQHYGEVFP